MADRLAIIATLMIAFIDLIPNVRDKIPLNPHLTLVEILLYLQTLTTLLVLAQSFDIRDYDEDQSALFI